MYMYVQILYFHILYIYICCGLNWHLPAELLCDRSFIWNLHVWPLLVGFKINNFRMNL